jgi:hypothetical protein
MISTYIQRIFQGKKNGPNSPDFEKKTKVSRSPDLLELDFYDKFQ